MLFLIIGRYKNQKLIQKDSNYDPKIKEQALSLQK
jgi:uncharacterized protein YneF (UPF0154 family)